MLGVIDIKADSALNQLVLIFGSCYILFDGGASLRLKVLKEVWITIVILATVGRADHRRDHRPCRATTCSAFLSSPCCSAPPSPRPIRQRWCRYSASSDQGPRGADGDERIGLQRCHRCDPHFRCARSRHGQGEFSCGDGALDLLKQAVVGIVAGGVTRLPGGAVDRARKIGDFLAEYAPVVTLMAVIGAYLGADDLQASGFMAVFVFGIVLGNKDVFGFRWKPGEAQKLDDYVRPLRSSCACSFSSCSAPRSISP